MQRRGACVIRVQADPTRISHQGATGRPVATSALYLRLPRGIVNAHSRAAQRAKGALVQPVSDRCRWPLLPICRWAEESCLRAAQAARGIDRRVFERWRAAGVVWASVKSGPGPRFSQPGVDATAPGFSLFISNRYRDSLARRKLAQSGASPVFGVSFGAKLAQDSRTAPTSSPTPRKSLRLACGGPHERQ